MKKLIVLFFLSVVISISGCNTQNKKQEESYKSFDIEKSKMVYNDFVDRLKNKDIEGLKNIFSKKMRSEEQLATINDCNIISINLFNSSNVQNNGNYKTKIISYSPSKNVSMLDIYSITIGEEDGEYKVKDVKVEKQQNLFLENNSLYITPKGTIDPKLACGFTNIDDYMFSNKDKGKVNKVKIPKQNFGFTSISNSGEKILIVTKDEKNSFLGIGNMKENLSGASTSNGDNGEEGNSINVTLREPSILSKIVNIDVFDENISNGIFSLKDAYVAVEFSKEGKDLYMGVYNTESGNPIKFDFNEEFPKENFEITPLKFENKNLFFKVNGKENNLNNDKIGMYLLNIDENIIQKQ